jgi:cell division septation protein DedD
MMNTQGQYLLGIILFLGCVVAITPAEAAITVQTFNPPVEVLLKEKGVWEPLSDAIQLDAGDQILTGKGGSVDLLFEDGSTLHLDAETQLAISELEFSVAEKTRVSRLKLFWGAITAKAATLAFKKNVFEVETDTVVVGFKFSSMKIISKPVETLDDLPSTRILPIEGKFEIRQFGEGTTYVESFLEANRGGIVFSMNSDTQVTLEVDQTQGNERIGIRSNASLQNMRALLSNDRNLLHIENAVAASTILVGFQSHAIKVEQNSSAVLGLPFGQADHEIRIEAEEIDTQFLFRTSSEIPENRFYVLADSGIIEVDGQRLEPESFVMFPIEKEEEEPAPATAAEEQPVAPSAPEQPSGGTSRRPSDAAPTPTPEAPPERPPEEDTGSPVLPE